jgi:hypothetical protein
LENRLSQLSLSQLSLFIPLIVFALNSVQGVLIKA